MMEKEVTTVDIESRILLRRNTLRDVNYLISKSWVTEAELYNLVKGFLKSYLNLGYEFTKEELFKELTNVYMPYAIRTDFFKFIEQVFLFEYSDVEFTNDEIRLLLHEFKKYVELLLSSSFSQSSIGRKILLKKARKKLVSYLSSIVYKDKKKHYHEEEIVEQPHELQTIDPIMNAHIDINSLIEKVYISIDHADYESAKSLYNKVLSKYQFLTADEKTHYYSILNEVYRALMTIKPN